MHRFPLVRLLIACLFVLGSLSASLLPVAAQETAGSSASTPVPVGTSAQVDDYELTVLNVMPDAADYIVAYNEFNPEPEAGLQFFLAQVTVTYTGETSGSPTTDLSFGASTGVADAEPYLDWGYACGDLPDSTSRANELFTGGTVEFNVCWAINEGDAESLVMQVSPSSSYDESDRVWFSLGNVPLATPEPGSGLKTSTASVPNSRTEPISVGTSSLVGSYAVEVITTEPDATDQIVTDESFNEPPADGNQFFMVTVSVTNHGEESVSPWWDLTFNAVGDQAIGYTESANSCGYIPNGAYEAPELAPGESAEFNVCWQVPTEEASSLVMYVDSGYASDERAWFAIQP